ncbi:transcription factor HES-7.1-B-like [Misgurnus anguillicaudatus]|uniref:transcription factor HES-7.1-B-like n=1 Tax=Misgurnus anguillicaudatus TaxID=75329 RepID=UPI0024355E50|nr:transcription factor HES-7.1-B-like [Misgurnus anguillicaudatus]
MLGNSSELNPHTFIWRFGSINRGALYRDLQHRDTDMTPTITSAVIISEEHLHLNNKLRKPKVEKMRRDRINKSIEQLKDLLDPEFIKQQSDDTKLEKADILEMTVRFLRHQQQKKKLLKDFQNLQTSSEEIRSESVLLQLNSIHQDTFSEEMNDNKSAIWRPW